MLLCTCSSDISLFQLLSTGNVTLIIHLKKPLSLSVDAASQLKGHLQQSK